MYRIIYLIVVNIILFNFVSLPQEKAELIPDFFHTWLQYDFYEGLINGKTPCELNPPFDKIMQLYFYKDNKKIFMGTFNEGIKHYYNVINEDTIEVFNSLNNKTAYVVYLSKTKSQTNLILKEADQTSIFAALEDKYYKPNGVENFINDKFFTGKYVAAEDSTLKIIFTSDGCVKGINNFNRYSIPVNGVGLPRYFDTILLLEIDTTEGGKVRNSILLHWEKSKDKIILYNVSKSSGDIYDSERYIGAKILGKYLTLKSGGS